MDLKDAHQMLFANLFMYRVSRNVLPKLNAVEAADSSDIRFENVHDFSMTRLAFDNSVFDATSGVRVRTHDFTAFTMNSEVKTGAPLPLPAGVFAAGAKLEQVASGFSNIAGLTTDDGGHLFFTDAAMHQIYKWNADDKKGRTPDRQSANANGRSVCRQRSLLVQDYSRAVFSVDTNNRRGKEDRRQ